MDEIKYTVLNGQELWNKQELSPWTCYLFGNRIGGAGMSYRPRLGKEPNWFVRWMMLVCFDCLWVKEKNT